jgi:hypothetical protein
VSRGWGDVGVRMGIRKQCKSGLGIGERVHRKLEKMWAEAQVTKRYFSKSKTGVST